MHVMKLVLMTKMNLDIAEFQTNQIFFGAFSVYQDLYRRYKHVDKLIGKATRCRKLVIRNLMVVIQVFLAAHMDFQFLGETKLILVSSFLVYEAFQCRTKNFLLCVKGSLN